MAERKQIRIYCGRGVWNKNTKLLWNLASQVTIFRKKSGILIWL